jgi:hypothetical protein
LEQRLATAEAEIERLGRCNEQLSLSHAEIINSQNAELAEVKALLREASEAVEQEVERLYNLETCTQEARPVSELVLTPYDTAGANSPQREIDELQQRLAAAEADVVRYDFLRQHKARASSLHMDGTSAWHFTGGWPPLVGASLDAALDAAIATWNSERRED